MGSLLVTASVLHPSSPPTPLFDPLSLPSFTLSLTAHTDTWLGSALQEHRLRWGGRRWPGCLWAQHPPAPFTTLPCTHVLPASGTQDRATSSAQPFPLTGPAPCLRFLPSCLSCSFSQAFFFSILFSYIKPSWFLSLYEFPLAAVTNCCTLSGLRRPRSIILHTFGGQQSRMGFPGPREASGDHPASSSSKGESVCLSFPGPGTPESSVYAPSSSYTPPTSVSILMSPFLTLLALFFIF